MLLDLLPKVLDRPGRCSPRADAQGKGLPAAEADHEGFHGVAPFDKVTGKAIPRRSPGRPGYTAVSAKR
jgi:deoxyxylulose-5-phosphate synthase